MRQKTPNISKYLKPTQTKWGHSRWELFERCPKAYELRYVHKVFPRGEVWDTKPAAALGTIVHRGLAAYFDTRKLELEPEEIVAFWKKVVDAGPEPMALKLDAMRIISAHNLYWEERDESLFWDKITSVERELKGEFGPNLTPFTTRVDLVGRRKKRAVWVDHKTSSKEGDSSEEFGMSAQFLGMLNLRKTRKHPIIMINRLVKTKEPKFDRVDLSFTDREVERWKRDFMALDDDLYRCERSGRYPRKYHNCMGRYGRCEYAQLCKIGPAACGLYEMDPTLDPEVVAE